MQIPRARSPPVLVPAIQSKHSLMGFPTSFSIAINIRHRTIPLIDHFGEVYKNVDMRGEVALINRNIVIEGEADADGKKMGGHIKVGY